MTSADKKYWDELNEMYGLDIEMPKDLKLDMSAVQFDIAMGHSIDSAMQYNMETEE